MRKVMLAVLAATMSLFLGAAAARAPIPDETGYLTDQTGIIGPAAMAQIQVRLARYHAESGRKISVLLVQETAGEELESYADRVVQQWGLAQVKAGGALLLWSAEGYVLIRVTDALAQKLPVEQQFEIISRWIVPAFAEGDAGRGIQDGVARMIGVIDGEAVGARPTPQQSDEGSSPEEGARVLRGSDPGAVLILEPAVDLPSWIAALPNDLERLGGALNSHPITGARKLLAEAGGQWRDLRVEVHALVLQWRGEQVEPATPPFVRNAFYVLGGVLVVAVLLLLGRARNAAAILVGIVGAPALWAATGFTALAVCVLLGGMLLPVLLVMARVVMRGGDERDPDAVAAAQLNAQLAAMASKSRHAASFRPMHAAPSTPANPRTAITAPATVSTLRPATATWATAKPPSRQDLQQLANLLLATIRYWVVRLRLWHLGLAMVLLLYSPALAFLAALGVLTYGALQRGLLRAFLELAWRGNAELLRQLQKLPAPDAADLKRRDSSSGKSSGA